MQCVSLSNHSLMAAVSEAAAHLDVLPGKDAIHLIAASAIEVRLLAANSAVRVTGIQDGLLLQAWRVGTAELTHQGEDLATRVLAAEAAWAMGQPPMLMGSISRECLAETAKRNMEDYRTSRRLAELFSKGNLMSIKGANYSSEDEALRICSWSAVFDIVVDFAEYAALNNAYPGFAADCPGATLTSVETEGDAWHATGLSGGYWWHLSRYQGIARLRVGSDEFGCLWSSAIPVKTHTRGHLATEDHVSELPTIIRRLAPRLNRSPFPYRFFPIGSDYRAHAVISYGDTPEEAYTGLSAVMGIPQSLIPDAFAADPHTPDNRTQGLQPPQRLFRDPGSGVRHVVMTPERRDSYFYAD
jgi:hypothetical protein